MKGKDLLLNLLQSGPKTTYELCVNGLAASYRQRMDDLRKDGFEIEAQSKRVNGQTHTVWVLKQKIKQDLFV